MPHAVRQTDGQTDRQTDRETAVKKPSRDKSGIITATTVLDSHDTSECNNLIPL